MIAIAMLISDLVWGLFTIGGGAYLVFWRGESGWYLALAIALWVGGMTTKMKVSGSPAWGA